MSKTDRRGNGKRRRPNKFEDGAGKKSTDHRKARRNYNWQDELDNIEEDDQ